MHFEDDLATTGSGQLLDKTCSEEFDHKAPEAPRITKAGLYHFCPCIITRTLCQANNNAIAYSNRMVQVFMETYEVENMIYESF